MSRPELALEQMVLRAHKALLNPPRSILMAVSGGRDSIVMAEILWKWRRGMRLNLAVAHIHHGPATSNKQTRYRARAQEFVREWAARRELPFFTNAEMPPSLLNSEQEWRDWRTRWLNEWRGESTVALAHHLDDLLETRLIRLIRGSGGQGIRAMSAHQPGKWRPLLQIPQSEIRSYAEVRELTWVEDPSNKMPHALRNWMRRDWLPSLEGKRPGALKSLARSLENLTAVAAPGHELHLGVHTALRRASLAAVSLEERRELLARYLKSLGLKGYGQSHVEEILKRLARDENEFIMLGTVFKISHDFLWASRV